MGNAGSLSKETIAALQKVSVFTEAEILDIFNRVMSIAPSRGGNIDINDLISLPELTFNAMIPRIAEGIVAARLRKESAAPKLPGGDTGAVAPVGEVKVDSKPTSPAAKSPTKKGKEEPPPILPAPTELSLQEVVKMLSTLSPKATKEEKQELAFTTYDVDGDGYVSMDDLFYVIRGIVHVEKDAVIQGLVEGMFVKALGNGVESGGAGGAKLTKDLFVKHIFDMTLLDKFTVSFS